MKRRILIVDDLEINRLLLNVMLSDDFDIIEASDGEVALLKLVEFSDSISAVLLDVSMPVMNGFDVLVRIRASAQLSSLPVIMITGSDDDEMRIEALALGANDYVTKPYNPDVIKHCLRNQVAFYEASATVDSMRRDRLTGILNRDAFFEKATALIKEKPSEYYVISCVDIDGFKVINDQYGIEKGDEVLQLLAESMKAVFESADGLCGRIYADYFVGIRPLDASESRLNDIQFCEEHILRGSGVKVTLCVGSYEIDDIDLSVSAMYDRANMAQHTVKGRYDTHTSIYDESMRQAILREQSLINDMWRALTEKQFELWLQPQYNHYSGALIGAEALARWNHPTEGFISPGEFIPIFERNGFVYELDKYIWEQSCILLNKWKKRDGHTLPISVNISRYDLFCDDFLDTLIGLLHKYELDPHCLHLEVTESAFKDDSSRITDVVTELVAYGFTVEIDDFGSGYSSLNTLKDVPAQVIKLDLKFLEKSDCTNRGGNIIESIVRMAKWLGMSIIAEGVETIEQANYLRNIGCYYVQGFFYSKPMPAAKYETLAFDAGKEFDLISLSTVDNLDNNSFWNPNSMDTLIFNSYVGSAAICEYYNGRIELLRVSPKFARRVTGFGLDVKDLMRLDWSQCIDDAAALELKSALEQSISNHDDFPCELFLQGIMDGFTGLYIRFNFRVIAVAGERYLVYLTYENITEQREAERQRENALERESRIAEHMRSIMANVDCGIAAFSIKSIVNAEIVFANERFYSILGYSSEQFKNECTNLFSIIHPDDFTATVSFFEEAIESKTAGTYEFRVSKRDGSMAYLRCNLTRLCLPKTEDNAIICSFADITEIILVQQSEKKASEKLQSVLENLESGISAVVIDGNKAHLEFANSRFFQIQGYTEEQFLNETNEYYQLVEPADRELFINGVNAVNEVGKSLRMEYRIRRRDGSIIWLRNSIETRTLQDVVKPVQISVITDITAEKLSEDEIRNASLQMNNMIDDMPGGFARVQISSDGDIRPLYFNSGTSRLIGFIDQELMKLSGKELLDLIHPDDREHIREDFSRIMSDSSAHAFRCRLRKQDGEYGYYDVVGRKSSDSVENTIISFYVTETTRELKLEQVKHELLDNLPSAVGVFNFCNGELSALYINRSYWQFVGRDAYDCSEMRLSLSVHHDDIEPVIEEISNAILQERKMEIDVRILNAVGEYVSFHAAGHIVRIDGDTYTIFSVFTMVIEKELDYKQVLPLVFSTAMDSASELLFTKDLKYRYISASRPFAKLVGYERGEDIIGKTDYDLFSREMADKYRADDEKLLQSGEALVDLIEAIPSSDGRTHYSSTSKFIIRDDAGGAVGLYCIGRDITNGVLHDSQLKLINDSIPGGLAVYIFKDDVVRISLCNDGFLRLFGGTREGFEKRLPFDPMQWVLEEDRHVLEKHNRAMLYDDSLTDCVFRIKTLEGKIKWVRCMAAPSERVDDSITVNVLLLDITNTHSILEQLRMSEEENSIAIQQGGNIVCRYCIPERTLTVPPDTAGSFSIPEMLVNVPEEPARNGMISPETAEAYTAFFESIIAGVSHATVVFQQQYLGDWRWIEAKSTTVFSFDGKPYKAIVSMFDVTDKLVKEAVYKKWKQSFDGRARESFTLYRCNINGNFAYDTKDGNLITFEFENSGSTFDERAVAYAHTMISDEDRDAYIRFINSDQMLSNYFHDKRQRILEYRELVNGGVRWIRLTVDLVDNPNSKDIVAYLMYEDIDIAKRKELHTKALSETDPLTGVLNRAAFAERTDRIIRESPPGACHALLMLDIDGFKQVNDVFGHGMGDQALIDLADSLRALARDDDLVARLGGDEFVVLLTNINGDYSALAQAKKICAFTRRSFSVDVQISGSIGIAYAPQCGTDFATLYKKADIALYYVKGAGKNSFVVYDDSMAEDKVLDEQESNSAAIDFTKQRMLIVDDNEVDTSLLANIFCDEFVITTAKDGVNALIQLKHYGNAISIVLLDLVMPEVDGFAVLDKMQEHPDLRAIPVIVVSVDERRATCLEAIRHGAADYVTKPIDTDILHIRVQAAVNKAENERIRANYRLLEAQNDERIRYDNLLDCAGIAFIEYNWLTRKYTYFPSVSKLIAGVYDDRTFWRILLSDMVADTQTVQQMQLLVKNVADDRAKLTGTTTVRLKAPSSVMHSFRMNVRKITNEFQLTNRIVISLIDLNLDM